METVKREGIDIVFAVDVSKLCQMWHRIVWTKASKLFSQIINQLGSDRIGIVAYAGNAFLPANYYGL
jgi:Ca-activated chloride channel family protein